jgi:hypothetical protein
MSSIANGIDLKRARRAHTEPNVAPRQQRAVMRPGLDAEFNVGGSPQY